LHAAQTGLHQTEHGALLSLYAAEAALGRARAAQAQLDGQASTLAREEASLRRRANAVRRSLATAQSRVAATLRELYVYGTADPLAAVLGASSLDEALTAIESLERAAAQNQRLAREARERGRRLHALLEEFRVSRGTLSAARRAAAEATVRLAQVTGEHRATVATVRARNARAAARVDELLAQARAAEKASEELAARAASEADTVLAEARPATTDPPAALPAPAPGTRTLVVEAVAYHLPGRTASGLPVGVGVVAVDPNVIPLGTRMFIPGYGPGIAADVGSAIRGNLIDLWMPSTAAARRWGRQTVTITIYG
jgi:peptidoglycan DL-endopeptidase CwlO